MSLEVKSKELKNILSAYDTQWFLGRLSELMKGIANGMARSELGMLSSPLRQLYFLGGLLVSSDPANGVEISYSKEQWNQIIKLLNEIEFEYEKLFFPLKPEDVDEQWKHVRKVAMPSFLAYFNQGPLNYEEQKINWVRDLFGPLDGVIETSTGLKTEDFIQFYENLDRLNQNNFQSMTTGNVPLRANWDKYSKITVGVAEGVPDFVVEMGEKYKPMSTFFADHGIIDRFYPQDIVSANLTIEKVNLILQLLVCQRSQTDYLYYTSTKPGNPLFDEPIIDIGDGMYQVFEVKQVIHAIENLLEQKCSTIEQDTTKYVKKKGVLLEDKVEELFSAFLQKDFRILRGYYVDGCEQDILILWKKYAFIIEAKGYSLREPLRDPSRAFTRIKDDFNACIGYGYSQTRRVENKFINEELLKICDRNGNVIEEIDTTVYEQDFSIIINLESFGQIQNDLSTLLKLENDDDVYPWVVKLDDLEVFLLTLIAKGKKPDHLIKYLLMREKLHGKLICTDELEVCGGFLTFKITDKIIDRSEKIVTTPDLPTIFDNQYNKVMGFKNEKYLAEKKSGKFIFL